MMWFYTRDQRSLTLETRFDNTTHEFVGIVTGLGASPITKRFSTLDAFRKWIETTERDLAEQHWKVDGAPHILPDGWRDKPWSL